MSLEEIFGSGTTPVRSDTQRMLLCKILKAGGGGGTAGAGDPNTVYPSGPPGNHAGTPYVDTLTGNIWWWWGGAWH